MPSASQDRTNADVRIEFVARIPPLSQSSFSRGLVSVRFDRPRLLVRVETSARSKRLNEQGAPALLHGKDRFECGYRPRIAVERESLRHSYPLLKPHKWKDLDKALDALVGANVGVIELDQAGDGVCMSCPILAADKISNGSQEKPVGMFSDGLD